MDSNICVFHVGEMRTMAFRGNIKPERWSRLLNPVDNMTRFALCRALGEGNFDYAFLWRTNSDVIGAFIGCLAKAKINNWDMFRLCSNLFNSVWCIGLEEAIMGLDAEATAPPPEVYMVNPRGCPALSLANRRPALIIRDNIAFLKAWPKMLSSIHFLLRWRGIWSDSDNFWFVHYLTLFHTYVEPSINLEEMENLNILTPNLDKSSKGKNTVVLPPHFISENPSATAEVILVYKKSD